MEMPVNRVVVRSRFEHSRPSSCCPPLLTQWSVQIASFDTDYRKVKLGIRPNEPAAGSDARRTDCHPRSAVIRDLAGDAVATAAGSEQRPQASSVDQTRNRTRAKDESSRAQIFTGARLPRLSADATAALWSRPTGLTSGACSTSRRGSSEQSRPLRAWFAWVGRTSVSTNSRTPTRHSMIFFDSSHPPLTTICSSWRMTTRSSTNGTARVQSGFETFAGTMI